MRITLLVCFAAVASAEMACTSPLGVRFDAWCTTNCNHDPPFCPSGFCSCESSEFHYPSSLPSPNRMWLDFMVPPLHASNIQRYETSIQVYQTWRLDQLFWNCIAIYHTSWLDAISMNPSPFTSMPAMHHTSEARALCMVHAMTTVLPTLVGNAVDDYSMLLKEHGMDMDLSGHVAAVEACEEDKGGHIFDITSGCIADAAEDANYSPAFMGVLMGMEMLHDMESDGWNADGSIGSDGNPCSSNCVKYGDTTGYEPVNSPWSGCSGDNTRWQPLVEHDNMGFSFFQSHITPHAGYARPIVLSQDEIDSRTLEDPAYDLQAEAMAAIDAVNDLNDFKKVAVEFLDNKIMIAGGMMMRLTDDYDLTLEQGVSYHYGYTSAEHDSVILAFKEKVAHDLVRPTTVVQAMGDDSVTSWGGPFMGSDVTMKARDWQPYIRVMPHSEYPSGSGCICLVVQEYVDKMLFETYGRDEYATTWEFPAGWSNVEPGMTPAEPVTIEYATMTELKEMCKDSRVWGGMHFPAAIEASETLCAGVGIAAYDLTQVLLNGVAV